MGERYSDYRCQRRFRQNSSNSGHEKRYSSGDVFEVGVRCSRSAFKGVHFRTLRMYTNGMGSFFDAARVVSSVTKTIRAFLIHLFRFTKVNV